ncbi:helix-turn-helix domain-containing protein [Kitasatospora sp. NPDC001603]|uniref:helix-turn-helix domain-containing protein n=1 Tax=Kitasatospora sp. NPDC001603 TaxID=3154388 RepID=UPI00332F6CBF
MSTLKFATSLHDADLRFVGDPPAAHTDRPLEGVYLWGPEQVLHPDRTRHQLVIIEADDPRLSDGQQLTDLMTHLALRQAAGLAVAAPATTEITTDVRSAAHRHAVPLLTVSPQPAAWMRLHRAVTEEVHRRILRTARLHSQLIDQVRHLGRSDGTQRIISWLASTMDAEITLTTPRGAVLAAVPESAPTTMVPAGARIAELAAAGRGRSAAIDLPHGRRQIRLFTVGATRPAPVLAVACEDLCPEISAAMARVLDLLAARLAIEEADRGRSRLQCSEHVVRGAILNLLMTGQVSAARSAATSLAPETLDDGVARTLILKVPRAQRLAIIMQCHQAIGNRAIVSGCPTHGDRIIVLIPSTAGDLESKTIRSLVTFTQAAPERYLGGSSLHTLDETASAYRDAARALAVAERTSSRVHLYISEVQLAHVLDQLHAGAWARHQLRPLLELPDNRRDQLLTTLGLGLLFTPAATARTLGTHRNTVARRLADAAALLGIDLQDVWQRALIGLALEVWAATAHLQQDPDALVVTDILDTAPVRQWAERFLGRLDSDRRQLRETLSAWIQAKARIEDTAHLVGLHPATVRVHLRSAEQLLQRRLLTNTTSDAPAGCIVPGAHDLVLAFFVKGGGTTPRSAADRAVPSCAG